MIRLEHKQILTVETPAFGKAVTVSPQAVPDNFTQHNQHIKDFLESESSPILEKVKLIQNQLQAIIYQIADELELTNESSLTNKDIYKKINELKKLEYRKLIKLNESETKAIDDIYDYFLADATYFSKEKNLPQILDSHSLVGLTLFGRRVDELLDQGKVIAAIVLNSGLKQKISEATTLKQEQIKKEEKLFTSINAIRSSSSKMPNQDFKEEKIEEKESQTTIPQTTGNKKPKKARSNRHHSSWFRNENAQQQAGTPNTNTPDTTGQANSIPERSSSTSNEPRIQSLEVKPNEIRGIHTEEDEEYSSFGKVNGARSWGSLYVTESAYVLNSSGYFATFLSSDSKELEIKYAEPSASNDEVQVLLQKDFKEQFLDSSDPSFTLSIPLFFSKGANFLALPSPLGYIVSDIAIEGDNSDNLKLVRSNLGITYIKNPPDTLYGKTISYKLKQVALPEIGVKYGDEKFAASQKLIEESRIFADDSKMHQLLLKVSPAQKEKLLLAYMRYQGGSYCDDPILRSVLNQCPNYLKALDAIGYYAICCDFQLAQELLFKQYGIQCCSLSGHHRYDDGLNIFGHARTLIVEANGSTREQDSVSPIRGYSSPRYFSEVTPQDYKIENIVQAYNRGEISEEALYKGLKEYRVFLDQIHQRTYKPLNLDDRAYAIHVIDNNDKFLKALKVGDINEISKQLHYHNNFQLVSTGNTDVDWDVYKIIRDFNKDKMLQMLFEKSKLDTDFQIPETFQAYFKPNPNIPFTCTQNFIRTIINNFCSDNKLVYKLDPFNFTDGEKTALKIALSSCSIEVSKELSKDLLFILCQNFTKSQLKSQSEADKFLAALKRMEIFNEFLEEDDDRLFLNSKILFELDRRLPKVNQAFYENIDQHAIVANILRLASSKSLPRLVKIPQFLNNVFNNNADTTNSLFNFNEQGGSDYNSNPYLACNLALNDDPSDANSAKLYSYLLSRSSLRKHTKEIYLKDSSLISKKHSKQIIEETLKNQPSLLLSPSIYEDLIKNGNFSANDLSKIGLFHKIFQGISTIEEYAYFSKVDEILSHDGKLKTKVLNSIESQVKRTSAGLDLFSFSTIIPAEQLDLIIGFLSLIAATNTKQSECIWLAIRNSISARANEATDLKELANIIRNLEFSNLSLKDRLIDDIENIDSKYSKIIYSIINSDDDKIFARLSSYFYSGLNNNVYGLNHKQGHFTNPLAFKLRDLRKPSLGSDDNYLWLQKFKKNTLQLAPRLQLRKISDKVINSRSKGWTGDTPSAAFVANKAGDDRRQYSQGDSLTALDHKATAKYDKPIVKIGMYQDKKIEVKHFIVDLDTIADYESEEIALAALVKELSAQVQENKMKQIQCTLTLVSGGNIISSFEDKEFNTLLSTKICEGQKEMFHHSCQDKFILTLRNILEKLKDSQSSSGSGFKSISFEQWQRIYQKELQQRANEFFILSNNSQSCYDFANQISSLERKYHKSYSLNTMTLGQLR